MTKNKETLNAAIILISVFFVSFDVACNRLFDKFNSCRFTGFKKLKITYITYIAYLKLLHEIVTCISVLFLLGFTCKLICV